MPLADPNRLTHPKYRPDIDGLRAIAVLAVVGFHAFPELIPGGFIGVDVFFVISGFLITGILLNSLSVNQFSFTNFYAHRIRRIFPALALVMLASLSLGWFALLPGEYLELGKQVATSSAFAANFLFWHESGYFDVTAELKPLLNLWSLGVEEQFYIIWPILLWYAWKKRVNPLGIIIFVGLGSFIYALITTRTSAAAGFFSPISRSWELLLGALLAYWGARKPESRQKACSGNGKALSRFEIICARLSTAHSNAFYKEAKAWLGLALIILGTFIINQGVRFPGGWALLPTLGALLLIAAGPHAWLSRKIISQKMFIWIGLISYPLYLWHWPILSFARIMEGGQPNTSLRLVAVGLSLLLAGLTYWLLERPMRWGKHLPLKTCLLCAAMTLCAIFGLYIYRSDGIPSRVETALADPLQALERPIDSLKNDACKKLHPDAIGAFCVTTATHGNEHILLIGDSHANRAYPGLASVLPKDRGITQLGEGLCLPFVNTESADIGGPDYCVSAINQAFEIAHQPNIDTVILVSRGPIYLTGKEINGEEIHRYILNNDHPGLKDPYQIFEAAMHDTLTRLQQTGKRVIFVLDVPELGFDPVSCIDRPLHLTNKSVKSPCAISRKDFDARNKTYRDLATSIAKDYPNVTIFDAATPFCDSTWCWAMKDGHLLYRDNDHLSTDGSKLLAKELVKILQ